MVIEVKNSEAAYNSFKKLCEKYIQKEILKYKLGNKIKIKKKNIGKFTESANHAGMGVLEYAKKILNSSTSTPLLKKRANFARNASKWKHS